MFLNYLDKTVEEAAEAIVNLLVSLDDEERKEVIKDILEGLVRRNILRKEMDLNPLSRGDLDD